MEYSTVCNIGIYQSSRSWLPAGKNPEQKYPGNTLINRLLS